MSTYFVVNCTITDAALLDEYLQGAAPSVGLVPMKVLAADNDSEVVEGTPAGRRTVLLEFDDADAFRTWYHSPEYQAAVGKRLEATDGFSVLVQGL